MKCKDCGRPTYGGNLICDMCRDEYNMQEDEVEFVPCDKCDGHPACEDFGCAFELGKGNMVKRNIEPGNDDWG